MANDHILTKIDSKNNTNIVFKTLGDVPKISLITLEMAADDLKYIENIGIANLKNVLNKKLVSLLIEFD